MTGRSEFLYERFLKKFSFGPTECQDRLFREVAEFVTCDDADILVVNGYAGTGKTSAMGAVIAALRDFGTPSVLLAPTGRAAKVLSGISKRPAYTIHKHIYRQKSVGDDGYGRFSLAPNKSKNTLFVVDEVSLIGLDMSQGQQGALFGTGNLLEDLVEFVRSGVGCRLIMMGDSAQLPPVGMDASPALSRSFMDGFGGVRYCELVSVVRQEKESGILRNATMLRELISSGAADSGLDSLSLDLRGVEDIARVSGGELVETLSDAYSRYGEDGTMVLCRSNKRAIRYNMGIRSMVQFKEEGLVRDDKLMIVKNCYQFVEDVKGLDYKLSRCCNPVFGDDVFGFVTRTEGIKIHRISCPNAARLIERYPYRIQKVVWQDTASSGDFLCTLSVTAAMEHPLLAKIMDVVGQFKVSMRSFNMKENYKKSVYEITIRLLVPSNTELDKVVSQISAIKGVSKIHRV